jgi:hypothetical protein
VTVTITALVQPSAANTQISNIATFSYDRNGDNVLETTGLTNPVAITPAAPAVAAIPTASTIGLLLMVVLIAGVALVRM